MGMLNFRDTLKGFMVATGSWEILLMADVPTKGLLLVRTTCCTLDLNGFEVFKTLAELIEVLRLSTVVLNGS